VRHKTHALVLDENHLQEVYDMENQIIVQEQEDISELDVEFVGELEDVTAGWTGPTDDTIDGDWTP
jgi:hypothetical protein